MPEVQAKPRFGTIPAQFHQKVDKSEKAAFQLYEEHYFDKTQPTPSPGCNAYQLYDKHFHNKSLEPYINPKEASEASGSGNNHSYTNPPMTPAEDLYTQFDIQSSKNLDVEEYRSQNNSSASAAFDEYH